MKVFTAKDLENAILELTARESDEHDVHMKVAHWVSLARVLALAITHPEFPSTTKTLIKDFKKLLEQQFEQAGIQTHLSGSTRPLIVTFSGKHLSAIIATAQLGLKHPQLANKDGLSVKGFVKDAIHILADDKPNVKALLELGNPDVSQVQALVKEGKIAP
jgi:hypothetical protein